MILFTIMVLKYIAVIHSLFLGLIIFELRKTKLLNLKERRVKKAKNNLIIWYTFGPFFILEEMFLVNNINKFSFNFIIFLLGSLSILIALNLIIFPNVFGINARFAVVCGIFLSILLNFFKFHTGLVFVITIILSIICLIFKNQVYTFFKK